MKKTSVAFFALLAMLGAVAPAVAQTNVLAPLGTDNFTVDSGATTASYSQSTTNLTLESPFALGDTLGGVFAAPYDWSAYSATNYVFGLFLSAPGASPGIPFTVEFYNGALDAIVNTYSGDASGLSTSPAFVPMTLSLAGTGDFSSIGGMQFTWDGSGTGTVVADSVAVSLVPEPTTWALLFLGSALFGGLALRRRLPAARP